MPVSSLFLLRWSLSHTQFCCRCNLASLLTIALHGKLEYYTSIMKDLLVDLIDASASKNPKLMLRRTESVVEKMLTNWMSICMYSYLRVRESDHCRCGCEFSSACSGDEGCVGQLRTCQHCPLNGH